MSVLLFWEARGVGGGEIGSEHEEDVYEICGKSKKQGIQRRRFHFIFDSIIVNYQWTRNAKKEESMIKLGIPGK